MKKSAVCKTAAHMSLANCGDAGPYNHNILLWTEAFRQDTFAALFPRLNMKSFLLTYLMIAIMLTDGHETGHRLCGTVLDRQSGSPVGYAAVLLETSGQWTTADQDGKFCIANVSSGRNILSVSCLGYAGFTAAIEINGDISGYTVFLDEDNLALESVVVTASQKEGSAATSRIIDRTALDHIQALNVSDISALLPGGATSDPSLTSEQKFSIRTGSSSEAGNPSFGTAVEIDGTRLSNNSSFRGASGVPVNNIASSDIESVEIISGVPSAEYGDISTGIVRINTRKGVTPFIATFSTNPKTKQVSVSKGVSLGTSSSGKARGILNTSAEYTRAVSNLMSPYTSYDRKQLTMTYSNTFCCGSRDSSPLYFSASASGNLGGYDTEADPDTFLDTYTKKRDNMFRGNFSIDWLLDRKWITSIKIKGSAVYNDRQTRTRENYSSAASTIALHGTGEGYFIASGYGSDPDSPVILIPAGYWYNTMCLDDRPINASLSVRADWIRTFGKINSKMKAGAEWTLDKNLGKGQWSEDISTAPSFRPWDYSSVPAMNNMAMYIEENIVIPAGGTQLSLTAGIRGEDTYIRNSAYGNTFSLSPRLNARYDIIQEGNAGNSFLKSLSIRAGWGTAVKLPSFSTLYPEPTYMDIRVFNPTSSSDGAAYYAYYIRPRTLEYNSSLKWQKSRQAEIGAEADMGFMKISLTGYFTRIIDSYTAGTDYERFSYRYTGPESLAACTIPADNRIFTIDKESGEVTVHDATGASGPQTLASGIRNSFISRSFADNSLSPVTRYGVEWVIDFRKIRAINTTFRLDGNFYGYRYVDSNIIPSYPSGSLSADGSPFKYVGYYYGGSQISNGRETKSLSTNLTVTTHIPKIRLIVSLKIEASLMKYSRYLSEKDQGTRSHVTSGQQDYFPSEGEQDIYSGKNYTIMYPVYYVSYDDPTPRDFMEDFRWAAENDPQLYTDLSRLVVRSNYLYFFSKDWISPYFSANISVTKEIGDIASVSFYANNFFNNSGQVYSTRTGQYTPVSSYIPSLFYGLSIRLRF